MLTSLLALGACVAALLLALHTPRAAHTAALSGAEGRRGRARVDGVRRVLQVCEERLGCVTVLGAKNAGTRAEDLKGHLKDPRGAAGGSREQVRRRRAAQACHLRASGWPRTRRPARRRSGARPATRCRLRTGQSCSRSRAPRGETLRDGQTNA